MEGTPVTLTLSLEQWAMAWRLKLRNDGKPRIMIYQLYMDRIQWKLKARFQVRVREGDPHDGRLGVVEQRFGVGPATGSRELETWNLIGWPETG
jgi:hypothetical protein